MTDLPLQETSADPDDRQFAELVLPPEFVVTTKSGWRQCWRYDPGNEQYVLSSDRGELEPETIPLSLVASVVQAGLLLNCCPSDLVVGGAVPERVWAVGYPDRPSDDNTKRAHPAWRRGQAFAVERLATAAAALVVGQTAWDVRLPREVKELLAPVDRELWRLRRVIGEQSARLTAFEIQEERRRQPWFKRLWQWLTERGAGE